MDVLIRPGCEPTLLVERSMKVSGVIEAVTRPSNLRRDGHLKGAADTKRNSGNHSEGQVEMPLTFRMSGMVGKKSAGGGFAGVWRAGKLGTKGRAEERRKVRPPILKPARFFSTPSLLRRRPGRGDGEPADRSDKYTVGYPGTPDPCIAENGNEGR